MTETKVITKQLAGSEDIIRGIGSVNQRRSTGIKPITKLNSSELQGALVVNTIAERDALVIADLGDTKTVIVTSPTNGGIFSYEGNAWVKKSYTTNEIDLLFGSYANLGGNPTQRFKVADAVTADEAVSKAQLDALQVGGGNDSELFIKPDYEIPLFVKISPNSFKVPLGTRIVVGGTTISLISDTILSLTADLDVGTKTAGTDYYVYARADSTFYISANKTISSDRLIGGFHYSLVPENEALTGNKTEADMVNIRGINAYSFWDLKFRPISNPEGMVYVGGKWYDIYLLNSEHIVNGTSKANATIAGGATTNGRAIPKIPLEYGGDGIVTYGKLTWFQVCEIAKAHSKELISYEEFMAIAYGVNEQKSSQTNAYEVVVGKIEHYSNLTSKYGIEQASGTQWIWGKNVGGNRDEGSIGWAWRTGLTDNRGNIYALHNNHITAVLLGGFRINSISSGSRASLWRHYVWASDESVGCRFACDHLKLV